MTDPTLAHDFVVGDRVRGKSDAGPNDRRFHGVVIAIQPHIVGHARDVIVDGYWDDDGVRQPGRMVGNGTEFERE